MRITFTKQLAAAAIALSALISVTPSPAVAAPASLSHLSLETGTTAQVVPVQYYGGRREAMRREEIRRQRERERARHYRRYDRRFGH